jgi:hypothetical protein
MANGRARQTANIIRPAAPGKTEPWGTAGKPKALYTEGELRMVTTWKRKLEKKALEEALVNAKRALRM